MGKKPLSEILRPKNFDEMVGQEHLISSNSPFRQMIESGNFGSFLLWGPPGVGKTTIARIISQDERFNFVNFSAISQGIPELKKILSHNNTLFSNNKKLVLFIDEIHHFNKTQQDFFLPYIESGELILIAATTENPSFQLINPLLSRLNIFVLKPLEAKHIKMIIERAIEKKSLWTDKDFIITEEGIDTLISLSNYDARIVLNILENIVSFVKRKTIDKKEIEAFINISSLKYDKKGDLHYELISALHKSLRGSDVDAALYWAERILISGENPLYLIRRLVRFASEDVGLADPDALQVALNAKSAYEFLGSPEGELAILEAVIYLALAPKSNTIYMAEKKLKDEIRKTGNLDVPLHIRNAPTQLMKDLEYGKGYEYSHNFEMGINVQDYFPKGIKQKKFYIPKNLGYEEKLKKRLEYIMKIKKEIKSNEKN